MSFFRASNDFNKMGTQNGVFLSKGTSKLEMSETGSHTEFTELMGGVSRELFVFLSAVVSESEGILSSSRRKESLTFCLFISSTESVEDRFRFLDKGDQDDCSEETEGPIIELCREFSGVSLSSEEPVFLLNIFSSIFQNQEDLEKTICRKCRKCRNKITKHNLQLQ